MRLHLPAGAALDLLDGGTEAQVLDVGGGPAALADDVVMVSLRLAGHVGVVAAGEVDALQDLQLGEEVEGAEDRRPPDAETAHPGVFDEVRSSEMTFARGDQLGDHAPRLRQAVAGRIHRLDEGRRPASGHPPIRRRSRDHVSDSTPGHIMVSG